MSRGLDVESSFYLRVIDLNYLYSSHPYIFQKGGLLLQIKKNHLSSPVAMGDNGHLQPSSRFPACIMAGELKILETNLKSEEIIKFISYFCRFHCVYDNNCFVLLWFSFFLVSGIRLGVVLKRLFFSESWNRKAGGCWEGCKTPKCEFCKGWEGGGD